MNDNKQKLMELLEKDETLRGAIFGKETLAEAYAAAKAVVPELTPEDFEGCVQEVKAQDGLLSDQQLEAATGGWKYGYNSLEDRESGFKPMF